MQRLPLRTMLRKILGTAGSKLFTALVGILVLILNSNLLGREGVGTIGLIVFAIMIIIMVSNLVGGSALVYLAARHPASSLLLPSYLWSAVISLLCSYLMQVFGILPEGYFVHILLIALMESITSANLNYLAGIQRIRAYNLVSVLQYASLAIVLLLMYFVADLVDVMSYVYALYSGAALALLLSFRPLRHLRGQMKSSGMWGSLRELFRYGIFVQSAALLHLFTLRINYFFIDAWAGRAALGVFEVNNKLNDGIWLPGKSIALVQYSAIANSSDPDYAARLSIRLWKFQMMLTAALALVFVMLPSSFYTFVFGKGFEDVRTLMLIMAPGVLCMASNTIMAHYFSGRGKHYFNSIGSGIGMLLTVSGGLLLIRPYGLIGAGITASLSYTFVAIYSFIVFKRVSGTQLKAFLPLRSDFGEFRNLIRSALSSKD
jgi:O-antigen/teichoic acid export membrane protein